MKLDRTVGKAHTAADANNMHKSFYQSLTPTQRLEIAYYLISVAYGFVGKPFPAMDKTKFSMRSSNNG